MYIKLYLSDSEKKQLEEIAQTKKISLSKLCYEQLVPLLYKPIDALSITDSERDFGKLERSIKVYFTETEYQNLLSASKGLPLSRYLRREYLHRREPIVISVYTDDISTLALQVSTYIDHFNNFVAALALRQQLYEADYQKMIQIADDTRKALKDVATYTRNNRKSIRASGIRILRKEIKRAIESTMKGSDTP